MYSSHVEHDDEELMHYEGKTCAMAGVMHTYFDACMTYLIQSCRLHVDKLLLPCKTNCMYSESRFMYLSTVEPPIVDPPR